MRILVVEDERKVAKVLRQELEDESFTVDVAFDGEEGELLASQLEYDLIILDILLPKKDGITVLRNLKAHGVPTPILMLSAKSSVEDKVEGLNNGADDYLPKPFANAEVRARARALVRRRASEKSTILKIADLELDTVKHTAFRGDKRIDLTAREYSLLEFLMRNANHVLTRSTISQEIWNYNFDTGTNIVDVYINHLRSKIDDGFDTKLLHTVRGVGYEIRDEQRAEPV